MVEVMARKSLEPAPSVADQREGLSPELANLIDECLEVDPDRRPASARVFLARLDDTLRSLPRDSRPAASAATSAGLDPGKSRDSELVDPEGAAHVEHAVEVPAPATTSSGPSKGPLGIAAAVGVAALVGLVWFAATPASDSAAPNRP